MWESWPWPWSGWGFLDWVVAMLTAWAVLAVLVGLVFGRAAGLAQRRAAGRLGRHAGVAGRMERWLAPFAVRPARTGRVSGGPRG